MATASSFAAGVDTNNLRRVEFREPHVTAYYLQPASTNAQLRSAAFDRIRAWPVNGTANFVELSSRIALQIAPGTDLPQLLKDRPLKLARQLRPDLVILQAASVSAAIDEAESLAKRAGVRASYPVMRRSARLYGHYAPAPNDPYFPRQWHLENRDTNGASKGVDLNARAAWSTTRGKDILVAIADDGFELNHPDLVSQANNQPHFNFDTMVANGSPDANTASHGTAVAGLVAATYNNNIGVSGLAPEASLASWVIFTSSSFSTDQIVSDEGLMDMFQYASNRVSVQNHSWGNADITQAPLDALSDSGISNAITAGRGGLGVVMVRAAGNSSSLSPYLNANDDGFTSDPRAIAVAAIRADGTPCSYTVAGACVLVAAPSGDPFSDGSEDPAAPNIVTTDRQGSLGYNSSGTGDSTDYGFGDTGFDGTSASSPQVAGIAALILAANPKLGYRDVQQILLQSARHFDFTAPDLHTNSAGFIFSHPLGFGVPDAGFAVALAKHWSNRPPVQRYSVEFTDGQDIPINPYRVVCQGPGISDTLTNLQCLVYSYQGPHPEPPTAVLPLVYVGQATNDLTQDLHGKAALIQRGGNFFTEKITFAANAGAAYAVIFNNVDGTNIVFMGGDTADPSILAVSISQNDGEALRDYVLSQTNNAAQIVLTATPAAFTVTNTAICEHVGVQVQTTADTRGTLRIVLVSPAGTRSVLQDINTDTTAGPTDWTYWSVQHFYESSFGTWRLEISDEFGTNHASLAYAKLFIDGVPITDTDHDGLDDNWEMKWFGTLTYGPQDNPGGDGYSNARKQCLDTNPTRFDPLYSPDLSFWNDRLARLSFPGVPNRTFLWRTNANLSQPFNTLTNVPGRLPEVEVFVPYQSISRQFFQAVPEN